MRLLPAIFAVCMLSLSAVTAQERVSVFFWNVENLFDTIPSPFYDDSAYTPSGRYEWDTEKYNRKLTNLSRVINDAGADIIALAEVENEGVVRSLVLSLADDYCYIHRTSGDRRGIDLALLYKGDKFFPETTRLIDSRSSREFLHVRGVLAGEAVDILVCHLPSKANRLEYRAGAMGRLREVADSLSNAGRGAKTIIMGDFNCDPSENPFRKVFGKTVKRGMRNGFHDRSGYYGAAASPRPGPQGSYIYQSRLYLFDNILLSPMLIYDMEGLSFREGGVFVKGYMLEDARNGYGSGNRKRHMHPFRTFAAGRYLGGYSDHLPVYIVLQKK